MYVKLPEPLAVLLTAYFVLLSPHRINCDLQFPRGHREPLGSHRDSDGHIDIIHATDMISPQEFWNRYASIRKPVLFKGAAKTFPAFSLWTDEYLTEHYGDMKVKLEGKIEKDVVPVGEKGLGQDTIKTFLETYRERDAYIVSQLPDAMSHEVMVLPCVMCGSFKDRILEANLWISSGGTKSLLHRDADNAFNCLLNGTKDWILIDPKHEHDIPIAMEAASAGGGFALLDPDKVNLLKYPDFAKVPWQYANHTAGDCLFLPYGYWHRVLSYGSKNVAASVLFSRLKEFDPYGCDDAILDYTPLSDVNMVWGYDGYGEQTMGNPDPYDTIEMFNEYCSELPESKMDANDLFTIFAEQSARLRDQDEETFDPEDVPVADFFHEVAEEVLLILDKNDDGVIQCDELENRSLQTWKKIGSLTDGDPANTEEYEYALYTPFHIRNLMMMAFDETNKILRFEDFARIYTEDGGSLKVAREVFEQLGSRGDDFVTEVQFNKNIDEVLRLFTKQDKHDPSGKEFNDALKDDRTMDDDEVLKTLLEKQKTKTETHHDEF